MANYNTYLPSPVGNVAGATSSVAGTAGLVPAPAAGDEDKVLRGDATFKFPCEELLPNGLQSGGVLGVLGQTRNWAGGGNATSANTAYAQAIWVPTQINVSTLRFRLNASSTANIRGGVYAPRSDGMPGSLQTAEFGPTALTGVSTGLVGLTSASTVTITRGLYWAVLLADGSVNCNTEGANWMWIVGQRDNPAVFPGLSISQTYGAMPSSFTGTWTRQESISTFFWMALGY
jgi:hypothetical protein